MTYSHQSLLALKQQQLCIGAFFWIELGRKLRFRTWIKLVYKENMAFTSPLPKFSSYTSLQNIRPPTSYLLLRAVENNSVTDSHLIWRRHQLVAIYANGSFHWPGQLRSLSKVWICTFTSGNLPNWTQLRNHQVPKMKRVASAKTSPTTNNE